MIASTSNLLVIAGVLMIGLIITSNLILFLSLSKKEALMRERVGESGGVYSSERRRIALICAILAVSFLIDCLYGNYGVGTFAKNQCYDWSTAKDPLCSFNGFVIWQEVYYTVDPLPLTILLIIHHRNFKFTPPRVQQKVGD